MDEKKKERKKIGTQTVIIIILSFALLVLCSFLIYENVSKNISLKNQEYYFKGQNDVILKMNACDNDKCDLQNGIFPVISISTPTNTTNSTISAQWITLKQICGVK